MPTQSRKHPFEVGRSVPAIIAWAFFAAVAGFICFALPPHLIPGAIKHKAFGQPLIPWFAECTGRTSLLRCYRANVPSYTRTQRPPICVAITVESRTSVRPSSRLGRPMSTP